MSFDLLGIFLVVFFNLIISYFVLISGNYKDHQKKRHLILVWFVPVIGAAIVLVFVLLDKDYAKQQKGEIGLLAKTIWVLTAVSSIAILLPLLLISVYYISILDWDDWFSPTENSQISNWRKWCEVDVRNLSSIKEIRDFMEKKGFVTLPVYMNAAYSGTEGKRKFYEMHTISGDNGKGDFISGPKNETHILIKASDRNVRNREIGSLIDKTLIVTITYEEGTITECNPVVQLHGR